MAQDVIQSAVENTGLWLPLVEYSLKSGVSLSTIRRKIKTNTIPFRLEKGKYLILFSGHSSNELISSPVREPQKIYAAPPLPSRHEYAPPPQHYSVPHMATMARSEIEQSQMPLLERAVKMVSDAFENTLKEKDEHIRLLEIRNHDLEERMTELQLLVKVLEEKYSIEY